MGGRGADEVKIRFRVEGLADGAGAAVHVENAVGDAGSRRRVRPGGYIRDAVDEKLSREPKI